MKIRDRNTLSCRNSTEPLYVCRAHWFQQWRSNFASSFLPISKSQRCVCTLYIGVSCRRQDRLPVPSTPYPVDIRDSVSCKTAGTWCWWCVGAWRCTYRSSWRAASLIGQRNKLTFIPRNACMANTVQSCTSLDLKNSGDVLLKIKRVLYVSRCCLSCMQILCKCLCVWMCLMTLLYVGINKNPTYADYVIRTSG